VYDGQGIKSRYESRYKCKKCPKLLIVRFDETLGTKPKEKLSVIGFGRSYGYDEPQEVRRSYEELKEKKEKK